MNPADEQENELVVLESIFDQEFKRTDSGCSIFLAPFPRDSNKKNRINHVSCELTFAFGPDYPNTVPASISVTDSVGLSNPQLAQIVDIARAQAAELVGAVSIFEVTQGVINFLTENNIPQATSLRDSLQMQLDNEAEAARAAAAAAEIAREEEEAAKQKKHDDDLISDWEDGIPSTIDIPGHVPVTPEVFNAWRLMFLAEQARCREKLGLEMVSSRPTGKQIFLQNLLSGLQMDFGDDDEDEAASAAAAAKAAAADAAAGGEVFWFNEGIYDDEDDEALPDDDAPASGATTMTTTAAAAPEEEAEPEEETEAEAEAATDAVEDAGDDNDDDDDEGADDNDAAPSGPVTVSAKATHDSTAMTALIRDLLMNGYKGPSIADLVASSRAAQDAITAAAAAEAAKAERKEKRAIEKKAEKQAKKDEKTINALAGVGRGGLRPGAGAPAGLGGFADFLGEDDLIFAPAPAAGAGKKDKEKKDKKEKKEKK